jgi:hypothetical protein
MDHPCRCNESDPSLIFSVFCFMCKSPGDNPESRKRHCHKNGMTGATRRGFTDGGSRVFKEDALSQHPGFYEALKDGLWFRVGVNEWQRCR